MIKPIKTFRFFPPIQNKGDWIIGLAGLEVCKSFFNIKEENNKIKLYKIPDGKSGGVSCIKVIDDIENDLDFPDVTASGLEDDIIGPINIREFRVQVKTRMKDDNYIDFLGFYVSSVFQDSESYFRT